jgi:hypothetical protein
VSHFQMNWESVPAGVHPGERRLEQSNWNSLALGTSVQNWKRSTKWSQRLGTASTIAQYKTIRQPRHCQHVNRSSYQEGNCRDQAFTRFDHWVLKNSRFQKSEKSLVIENV